VNLVSSFELHKNHFVSSQRVNNILPALLKEQVEAPAELTVLAAQTVQDAVPYEYNPVLE
jgi:hypothetical protein